MYIRLINDGYVVNRLVNCLRNDSIILRLFFCWFKFCCLIACVVDNNKIGLNWIVFRFRYIARCLRGLLFAVNRRWQYNILQLRIIVRMHRIVVGFILAVYVFGFLHLRSILHWLFDTVNWKPSWSTVTISVVVARTLYAPFMWYRRFDWEICFLFPSLSCLCWWTSN